MALSTYDQLWKAVLLRCPAASPFLAQDWINFSFRRIVEKRRWSWLIKRSQFIMPAATTTGNVDVTLNSATVQGHGTGWTTAIIGQQFRIGLLTPIYDVIAVNVGTQQLTLGSCTDGSTALWGGATTLATGYQIYLAYPPVPTDFHAMDSIWDPAFAWRLWLTVKQNELNAYDAQRAAQGTPYVCADYDYTVIQLGGAAISPPIPRFEIWPHQLTLKTLPFLYESRPPDLNDANATLPRFITGNVLLDGALAQAARWPGPDREHPNPYFNMQLALVQERLFDDQVRELERQDDEVYLRDVDYGRANEMPFSPYPFPINAAYLQLHSL